jgi:hypothetical protein
MSKVYDLPPIDPTGAMASGEYTDYMISYDNQAEDVEIKNMEAFSTMQTMEDWYKLWLRQIAEVNTRVSSLEKSLNSMGQQIMVIDTQLKSM